MLVLVNAFSLNMFPVSWNQAKFEVRKISHHEAKATLEKGFVSFIGHQDMANVLSNILGMKVEVNRVNYVCSPEDTIIVAQYRGPRLPEGTTQLPEGATIEFFLVKVTQL